MHFLRVAMCRGLRLVAEAGHRLGEEIEPLKVSLRALTTICKVITLMSDTKILERSHIHPCDGHTDKTEEIHG
jgi:hypothetical protein